MTESLDSGTKQHVKHPDTPFTHTNVETPKRDETLNLSHKRVEIDTSHPFESVKEAVSRFGGSGVWKPRTRSFESEHIPKEVDLEKVEEQASAVEKRLIVKERETLEVLKELETTKRLVEELKLKLQNEVSESTATPDLGSEETTINVDGQQTDEQTSEDLAETHQNSVVGLSLFPSSSPGLILMELKQAKVNLTRTTSDLADIRASVELLNKKLEKERSSLRKTRVRLTSNSSKILSLEEELNRTRQKLQVAKDVEIRASSDNPMDISRELQRLSIEVGKFKKMAEAAKSEVMRATSEIQQTKTSIRTAEIRWIAAKKMADAAKASEAVALAEIKALSKSNSSSGVLLNDSECITLSFEEYSSLTSRARAAEELSKKRVLDAELQVDEANFSKMQIVRRVEEAAEEVKTNKKALEKALNRVDAASRGKLAVEEALRKWRSEHGQKRRSVYNSSKFKNSFPFQNRRDSRLVSINMLNLPSDGSKPVLRPTLSIGQILSRKLLMPEDVEIGFEAEHSNGKPKVSLGQILGEQCGVVSPPWKPASVGISSPWKPANVGNADKQFSTKRKKFGFARFSLLLAKRSKKKKKMHATPSF